MQDLLDNNSLILMEAAIVEQLRRSGQVELDEILVNAPLIYDPASRDIMAKLYRQYMGLAEQAGLPFIACTPTWRAGKERVQQAGISAAINQDAVAFLKEIRSNEQVRIGGMIGCKPDCYTPEAGLSAAEAKRYHSWQIEQLAAADVDFLIAVTLPNVQEALGIARAMAATDRPYIISFVINRHGTILDGTPIATAVDMIDNKTPNSPLGYMINCAHPSFLNPQTLSPGTLARLIGFQANASSLDHCDLENADELHVDSIDEWGELMRGFNRDYGVKILGGCCGTSIEHLQYLVGHRTG
jgi:S-methylmethionine-dependent homocysteine/selenocysteine methylase